ncbi:FxsB family cyclophane-forming radical SAM/SPASM peptide maturase [Streptomyces sp. NPDC002574]|uniref:FxsB family cyclophane-forming radical SAM/SPASM peptide maturase n=1 Tax=Streptomyces sp. NPDC002574 TaxID=3364652 RepID=UPI003690BE3A
MPAVPFRQFVLKTNGRCNLACTYCYIYQGADQGWRTRPARASSEVLRRTAERIAEHVATHGLTAIRVELHGGEPLLGGPGRVIGQAAAVREAVASAVGSGCVVQVGVQTNGTLLTEDVVGRLAAAGISVGVSLDGGSALHNRRRVDHAGRSSWGAATRGLRMLARRPEAYAGILCTVDPALDPAEVYAGLLAFHPPAMDFLLPHATWDTPPPGVPDPAEPSRATPYGDWLARVFDQWWYGGERVKVRLFSEIIGLLLGMPGRSEAMGLSPLAAVVVETDGSLEQVDSLRTAYEGASATGMDVFSAPFDQLLDHPGIVARQLGLDALPPRCRACPVVLVCGGGNYAHRFRSGSGFRNPSVHCADLERLIRHIAGRLSTVVIPAPAGANSA